MKDSLKLKLELMFERFQEVGMLLSDANVIADQNKFKSLSKEYAELEPVANCFERYNKVAQDLNELTEFLDGDDAEMRAMAQEDIHENKKLLSILDDELQFHLLPKDPDDERNIYLEVRAGTGGDEAAIFAGDLFRMYSRFEIDHQQKWLLH